ncbi:hypothetical protein [Streptomyces sp. SP18CS02]|uniref:hypothetical protein n=1 Tax=Streptomyces sp. SP18CS02 TaxID=3002531 RepID=UPI002E79A065|nr:hypothetical protein [Streptomyces sp. SP18CS02]MEE1757029.1 hypothetical protein [Streptomyces sp. SP18CS02]
MAETKKTTQARTTTKERAQRAQTAARDTAQDAAESARGIGGVTADKARTAARTVQRTAATAADRTVGKVGVVWTLVKARKVIVAGAGAGVATAVASSYALGRRVGLRQRGPLSRLSGGRL